MPPLFGHAGWGGIVETLACMFLCSAVWIVGFALAGAVFRSPVLVGFSFVLAVAVVANIELSSDGYMLWAIILLAPLAAAGSFLPNYLSDSTDDAEGAAVVAWPTGVIERETLLSPTEWERSGPVIFRFPIVWLFKLCLLLFLLSTVAMLWG
ncbi:hypothetical protein [Frigoriglobus tundricola]|uniref:Transmembrane protein n=1 Tax=Frigoriglobus tundricola TaxID=2774151 RepID=A0A6M5YX94_9BACT|nr:hypothetical protein [Frigoriglobus tundricola]QJW98595.1 hypothetical protein FTUN_6190 [Frigoriglobus tundricola]